MNDIRDNRRTVFGLYKLSPFPPMQRTCPECSGTFTIDAADEVFYKRMDVPAAKNCPDCRLQRHLCERNPRNLYYRKCDASGKQIISQYHGGQPFPVYSIEEWSSDKWDALSYGRDVDFSRPFFEQFKELKNTVPHLALFNTPGTMENSDFNNCTAYLKNCYLIAESDYVEDSYYSNIIKHSKNIVDCSVCYDSELCYECIDCINCNRLAFSKECQNCSDSYFLQNCQSCRDCIGCMNQTQKQYMIQNRQYTKAEYEKIKQQSRLDTRSGIVALQKACDAFFLTQPHRALVQQNNENSLGDHTYNCRNAYYCFNVKDLEDCRYCSQLTLGVKSSMDFYSWGDKSELIYLTASCGDRCYNVRFCSNCITITNTDYCYECTNSDHLFGCVGVQRKKFCILNKQYTEEEYKAMKPKIIEHMKKTGEWGDFFPMSLAPFAYNEAVVMDHFPLTKQEVIKRGWRWFEEPPSDDQRYMGEEVKVPDAIADVPDDITSKILRCEVTDKPYKIIPQELKFHRLMNLPLPTKSPHQRHRERQAKRNPYRLWERECANCHKKTFSSIDPKRPEIVWCESCYLKAVY